MLDSVARITGKNVPYLGTIQKNWIKGIINFNKLICISYSLISLSQAKFILKMITISIARVQILLILAVPILGTLAYNHTQDNFLGWENNITNFPCDNFLNSCHVIFINY